MVLLLLCLVFLSIPLLEAKQSPLSSLPFSQKDIDRLLDDLARARMPQVPEDEGWDRGTSVVFMQNLVEKWLKFNFSAWQEEFWGLGRHQTMEIETVTNMHHLHFVEAGDRSLPTLVLLHGWPSSIFEFKDAIPLLVKKFHLVIPSLPGFGISRAKKLVGGSRNEEMSLVVRTLLSRLGVENYIVQGGDFGSFVGLGLCSQDMPRCRGLHLNNMFLGLPVTKGLRGLWVSLMSLLVPGWYFPDAEQRQMRDELLDFNRFWRQSGYLHVQATKPRTLAFAFSSPVGAAAWIVEKFHGWSSTELSVESIIGQISWYWLTNSFETSVQAYNDNFSRFEDLTRHTTSSFACPTGYAVFKEDLSRTPEVWAKCYFSDLFYYKVHKKGGHFIAWEEPQLFVQEVLAFVDALEKREKRNAQREL